MKKVTFANAMFNKLHILFLLIIVVITSRSIGQFLETYYNNQVPTFIIWLFKPSVNINIYWGIAIMSTGFIMLTFLEYAFKKISEEQSNNVK